MAGPRFVDVGQVVNPYRSLQQTVSQVGDIYRTHEQDQRTRKEFEAKEAERARETESREFLKNYQIEPGKNFTGITADTRTAVEAQEAAVWDRFNAQNPNASDTERTALQSRLDDARNRWVSAEGVRDTVTSDLRKAGIDLQTAAQYGQVMSAKYQPQGAARAQAEAEAAERNAHNEGAAKRSLELFKAESKAASGGRSSNRSGNGKSSASGGKDFVTEADITTLKDSYGDRIGGWDADTAVNQAIDGFNMYNIKARNEGRPTLPAQYIETALQQLTTTDQVNNGKVPEFKDAASFSAYLTKIAGQQSGGSGNYGGVPQVSLSPQARADILNPNRVAVSPTFDRDRISSFYASMVPEAQRTPETRPVVSNNKNVVGSASKSVPNPVPDRPSPPQQEAATPPAEEKRTASVARSTVPSAVTLPYTVARDAVTTALNTEQGRRFVDTTDMVAGVPARAVAGAVVDAGTAIGDFMTKASNRSRNAVLAGHDRLAATTAYTSLSDRQIPDSRMPLDVLRNYLPYMPAAKQAEVRKLIAEREAQTTR